MRKLLSLLVVVAILTSFAIPAFAADKDNTGYLEVNDGKIKDNSGTIVENNGEVKNNNGGGTIVENNGEVKDNNDGGTVEENNRNVKNNNDGATVVINNDTVGKNSGTVVINDGKVGTNETNGEVSNNYDTVEKNKGTVGVNYGEVTNEKSGTVEVNWGVVDNKKGGTVQENYGEVIGKDGSTYAIVYYYPDAQKMPYTEQTTGDYTIMDLETALGKGFAIDDFDLAGFGSYDVEKDELTFYDFGATGTTNHPMYLFPMYNPITHEVVYVPAYTGWKMVDGKVTLKVNRVLYRSAEQAANAITVDVDGKKVDAENYTVELDASYNIIVSLSDVFMGTLAAGEHVMTIHMASGYTFPITFTK